MPEPVKIIYCRTWTLAVFVNNKPGSYLVEQCYLWEAAAESPAASRRSPAVNARPAPRAGGVSPGTLRGRDHAPAGTLRPDAGPTLPHRRLGLLLYSRGGGRTLGTGGGTLSPSLHPF